MTLFFVVLAVLGPLRLFEVLPQKLAAQGGEISREAVQFVSMAQIGALSAGDEIEIPALTGTERYRVIRVERFVPGTVSMTATAPGGSGGHIAISISEDRLTGLAQSIRDGTLEHFGTDDLSGLGYRAKMTAQAVDAIWCGTDGLVHPPTVSADEERFEGQHPHQYPRAPEDIQKLAAASAAQDSVTIDLMLVYTPKAHDWANASENPGSMDLALAQAMNLSQQALDVSNLAIKLRLVHTHMTSYTESSEVSSSIILRRLTASPSYRPASWGTEADGYMDEVHTLRDQHGADIVAMLADVDDTGGLGWMLTNHAGNPLLGFNLNRIRQTHFTYTLIHEIGHNMGNDHGRQQDSAPADVFGGLNPYSTGFRWKASDGKGYATVMQYTNEEYPNRTPYFSSPDVQVNGVTIGQAGLEATAADNQRSMREIRRVISEYRETKSGNPNFSVTPSLSADLESGESDTLFVEFQNTGQSDAMFRVRKIRRPALTSVTRLGDATPEQVFATGFEASEGFTQGSHAMIGGWRTFSIDRRFQILRENPNGGQQHIRWARHTGMGVSEYATIESPQFGNPTVGHYRASFDFALSSPSSTRFYVYFQDAHTGTMAGGVLVDPSGVVYAYRRGVNGNLAFYTQTGWTVTTGRYHRLTFEIDPQTDKIRYRLGNLPVVEADNVGGNRISYIEWLPQNSAVAATVDLDNILVEQDYTYLPGFLPEKSEGTVPAGQTYRLPVAINTEGLSRGTYVAEMEIMTSSGLKTVNLEVRVDGGGPDPDLPYTVLLDQNFPNPFNPLTNITYTLTEAGPVRLGVYDVLGREVARLVDQTLEPGYYQVQFDAAHLASGVYIYRIEAGNTLLSRKMMLIK